MGTGKRTTLTGLGAGVEGKGGEGHPAGQRGWGEMPDVGDWGRGPE